MSAPALPKPTFLDRMISAVAPARGLQRLQARAAMAWLGGLGAGGYTGGRRAGRALKEYSPGTGSADSDTLLDLPDLRARSRDMVRNAPLASSAINTTALCVVGVGLVPHAELDADFLGLSEDEAARWQEDAERLWWSWAGTTACDIERRRRFNEILEVVLRSDFESGDVFVIWRARKAKGDVLAVKVQLVEADRVCNPNRQPDTATLRGGIETDPATGAPVAIHVMDRHPGDPYAYGMPTWTRTPWFGAGTGEPVVMQVMHHLRPGQTRGVPDLAPVIEVLKQVSRYTENELMATVLSSMFTAFIKSTNGDGPPAFAPIPRDGSNAGTAETTATSEYRLGNGAIVGLREGEDVTLAQPERPNTAFDAFIMSMAQQVGAAIGIPYEVLMLRFTASYSAARASLLQAWRAFHGRRGRLVDQFAQPCWERVITEAVARGYLPAPPAFLDDPLVRRAYLGCTWTGPTPGQINPTDEVNAAEKRLNLTLTTLAQEKAAYDGGDWNATALRQGRERKLREKLGLTGELVGERIITEPVQPAPARTDPSALPPGGDAADQADDANLVGAGT